MSDYKTRKTEQHVLPRSGRPIAAVSPEMLQRTDTIVRLDRLITPRKLALCLLIRKGGIYHII